MSDDQKHTDDATSQADQLPVTDLEQKQVDATAAEQVKGGATSSVSFGDIVVTKPTDTTSPKLF